MDFQKIIKNLVLGEDGIYSSELPDTSQKEELKLREEVADKNYSDYFEAISKSHSIPVMDFEVDRFFTKISKDGIILDIGGCWGWHWRNLLVLEMT